MVSDSELAQIMPGLPIPKRGAYLRHLQSAMAEFAIDRYLREAAFLAQIAHESAQLRYWEELWGPTPAQRRYEARQDLGNTRPGDGYCYRGRGPIQLTGRANYRRYGELLGLDLEGKPELAATPHAGFRVAGCFWHLHGLNELADQEDFVGITRRINGGTNGLRERQMYYRRALAVLSRGEATDGASVMVNGRRLELPDSPPWLAGERVMVPIRAVCMAAAWRLLGARNGVATLQDASGAIHRLPMVVRHTSGYVDMHDLPARTRWDLDSRTAIIDT